VNAVNPEPLVAAACARHGLDARRPDRLRVVAAGKAAPGMLRGFLAVAPGIDCGVVAAQAVRPTDLTRGLEWITAAHPAPDRGSERAGRRALGLASSPAGMREDRLLVVLLSGGASSMLAVPAGGITLEEKASAARTLMAAGASIAELNCVRKHLSAIKGGWLGAAAGWRVLTLALSDVHAPVADDPSVIGSGPTTADPTTFAEARAIVRRVEDRVPGGVRARLDAGVRGELAETPKPGDAGDVARYEIVGNRLTALAGMREAAAAAGCEVVTIEPATDGEARAAGAAFVTQAEGLPRAGRWCVIAAGETVVTVTGDGRGGRNQEFVLGALPALDRLAAHGLTAVLGSAGSDGVDGPTAAAGGIADTRSSRRAREAGVDVESALRRNDAHAALSALGDLIIWGPTGTNVGDLHVLLIAARHA
jgi:glycerate 2-kinase